MRAQVVVEGSVQSCFLPSKCTTDPNIEGTKPNHLEPVFCHPWHQFRLIQTGFLHKICHTYINHLYLKYYYFKKYMGYIK